MYQSKILHFSFLLFSVFIHVSSPIFFLNCFFVLPLMYLFLIYFNYKSFPLFIFTFIHFIVCSTSFFLQYPLHLPFSLVILSLFLVSFFVSFFTTYAVSFTFLFSYKKFLFYLSTFFKFFFLFLLRLFLYFNLFSLYFFLWFLNLFFSWFLHPFLVLHYSFSLFLFISLFILPRFSSLLQTFFHFIVLSPTLTILHV